MVVALCMDNDDELDEYFKGTDRPAFTVGHVGWETREEIHVQGVPQYFLLGEDRTLLLHTESLKKGEEKIRAILDEQMDAMR